MKLVIVHCAKQYVCHFDRRFICFLHDVRLIVELPHTHMDIQTDMRDTTQDFDEMSTATELGGSTRHFLGQSGCQRHHNNDAAFLTALSRAFPKEELTVP